LGKFLENVTGFSITGRGKYSIVAKENEKFKFSFSLKNKTTTTTYRATFIARCDVIFHFNKKKKQERERKKMKNWTGGMCKGKFLKLKKKKNGLV
jgi:hypothetical protein